VQSERFEWDDNKAAENYAKHHVTFELAKSVFDDPLSRSMSILVTPTSSIASSSWFNSLQRTARRGVRRTRRRSHSIRQRSSCDALGKRITS
jgi:hypothetical protein